MALNIAKERLRNRQVDWMALLPLAGGTVLLLLGLFCAWQTWLIADEGNAIQRVHVAQDEAVQAVSAEIASQRAAVEKVLTAVDPATDRKSTRLNSSH